VEDNAELLTLTADIAAAYVSNNTVQASDVPSVIQTIYRALAGVNSAAAAPAPEPQKPAVPIKKSITPDFLISLEDGKKYKSLKRHLRTQYNMSPEDYRAKWGLPKDYPMVAPNYAASRSALAKSMGLGRGGAAKSAAKPAAKPKAPRAPRAK
jgi:predicted transcriptional regulator